MQAPRDCAGKVIPSKQKENMICHIEIIGYATYNITIKIYVSKKINVHKHKFTKRRFIKLFALSKNC